MGIEQILRSRRAPLREKNPQMPILPPYSPPEGDRPQAELPLPDYAPDHGVGEAPEKRYSPIVIDMEGNDELVPDANKDGPNVFSMV